MGIPFVHVQARGSNRELGRAVGEAAREQVQASVDFFREDFASLSGGRLTFDEAERLAGAYGEQARRWLPHLVEELEGLAEGSGVPLSRLLVLNCGEEFTADEQPGSRTLAPGSPHSGDHCTAVAAVAGGRHIIGHNMDWYTIDAVNNVFFDLTGPDGTRIMGLAGAPYLLMLGMNSHGVGNVSNSVHSTDNRIGVPNAFVRRSTLDAPSLEEARDRGLLPARARGTNQFFADIAGRLWDLETSATAHALMDHTAAAHMAHANHYVSRCSPTRDTAGASPRSGSPRPSGCWPVGWRPERTRWISSPGSCAATSPRGTPASVVTPRRMRRRPTRA